MPPFPEVLTEDQENELQEIANKLVAPGKGILAADESTLTMEDRMATAGIENTEENHHRYRELLFTTEDSVSEFISGVIMFSETFTQKTTSGESFVKVLQDKGILPGIKLDLGVVPLAGTQGEGTTQGLDDLPQRCAKYKQQGAQFAKFRCVIVISTYNPSYQALVEKANTLARYAAACQQQGLVPIVDTEVMPDGSHDLQMAQNVTEQVLAFQFKALADHHVYLEGILMRVNMVIPGLSCHDKYTPQEIATATLTALRRTVPPCVPGITFQSSGQTEDDATEQLNAINTNPGIKPWALTFTYGRALQVSVLKAWQGDDHNAEYAQQIFLARAKANSEAVLGQYTGVLELESFLPPKHDDKPDEEAEEEHADEEGETTKKKSLKAMILCC